MDINDELEIDIENKYIKNKKNTKFTIEEAIYILKRKDFCDEVENIAINNLIQENKELKDKMKFIHINNLDDIYEETLEKTFTKFIKNNIEKDYIPKSKIKEIIYGDYENLEIILKIKELLEESD